MVSELTRQSTEPEKGTLILAVGKGFSPEGGPSEHTKNNGLRAGRLAVGSIAAGSEVVVILSGNGPTNEERQTTEAVHLLDSALEGINRHPGLKFKRPDNQSESVCEDRFVIFSLTNTIGLSEQSLEIIQDNTAFSSNTNIEGVLKLIELGLIDIEQYDKIVISAGKQHAKRLRMVAGRCLRLSGVEICIASAYEESMVESSTEFLQRLLTLAFIGRKKFNNAAELGIVSAKHRRVTERIGSLIPKRIIDILHSGLEG